MLERARRVSVDGLRFEPADIASFSSDRQFDVVFSNAALQWLPDHPVLFPRLIGLLHPEGELAVQMPANFDHPSHTVAAEVAGEPEFATALHGWVRTSPVLPPDDYAQLLHALGSTEQQVRLQVYGHVLESSAEMVEWTRGSLLTEYESRMDNPALFELFMERYRQRLLGVLGDSRPYFFAFKRLLMWARL